MTTSYKGQCFCGAVQIEVTGEPAAMGFCHCSDCRLWSAAPVNAFTLWPTDVLRVTSGTDKIGTYNKTERSYRKFCTTCGGHLFAIHPQWNLVDVYAAMLPSLEHKAGVHVNYQETVLRMHDGVTKLKDLPPELGGSGTPLPE